MPQTPTHSPTPGLFLPLGGRRGGGPHPDALANVYCLVLLAISDGELRLLELDCQLNWQSPGSGITYEPREDFTVGWKVTNTGRAVWYPGSVEFTYLAGAKLHDDPEVRLRVSVAPGQSVILSVGMRAPKNPAMYTTRWGLRKDDTYFCPVSLSIYVN